MFNNIYQNKKIFITGHTGFKGSWLALWLNKLGAEVCGYSLDPNTNPSMFKELDIQNKISKSIIGDILDSAKLEKSIKDFRPDIIFHLAAQPLVRLSYTEPLLTYQVNVIGTLNVLEAARKCTSVKAFVNITTDKCYENKERYSMATARAGNVIGGGDWALDRLIPDCIRNINSGEKIEIRNPAAIRPWQHVLEPLSGYLLLGQKLLEHGKKYAESFNFGPNENSVLKVADVAQIVIENYGKGEIVVHKKDNLHEANLLMLNIEKAEKILNWHPAYTANTAITKTVEWYKHFYSQDKDMYEFTLQQIREYEGSIKWNKNYVTK